MMNNSDNLNIYRLWAPIYDWLFGSLFYQARRRYWSHVPPTDDALILLPGVGTGQDFAHLPYATRIVAGDYSPHMLARSLAKMQARPIWCMRLDAQHLPFAAGVFDIVGLSLVLSVVPNGLAAAAEAWRVLRPGGSLGIFDKFVPPGHTIGWPRRLIGALVRRFGTDPNRRLEPILAQMPGAVVIGQGPSLLGGQYRHIWLRKSDQAAV
jgi:SAM-dependent methyltransferase